MFKYILKFLVVFRQIYRYSIGRTKHYYDGERKIWLHIAIDLIYLLLREQEFCYLYYALGYDQKGKTAHNYIGKKRIFRVKNREEKLLKEKLGTNLSYDVITKDKFYAGSICIANGLPAIEDLALVVNGDLQVKGRGLCKFGEILSLGSQLVIKNTILEASTGVVFLDLIGNGIYLNGKEVMMSELQDKVAKGAWVVQKEYLSHQSIASVNASALNIMRVTTIYNGKDVKIVGGFQAFATGNAKTDSWSEGSIYVGVDFERGCLHKHGFRSPYHEGLGLEPKHPDSRIVFEDFAIPYIEEIKGLVTSAHRLFFTNYLLGWDIAITDNGPMIVEINEKPGMNVMQCVSDISGYFLRS